jgi:hypothetical protein
VHGHSEPVCVGVQLVHQSDELKGINDASRKIGDSISVIDGIAFQTHILALNAAVASEVRSLAGRYDIAYPSHSLGGKYATKLPNPWRVSCQSRSRKLK